MISYENFLIGSSFVIALLAARRLVQSFVLSSHLRELFQERTSEISGMRSRLNSETSPTGKLKICLGCITSLENTLTLSILFLVMMAYHLTQMN